MKKRIVGAAFAATLLIGLVELAYRIAEPAELAGGDRCVVLDVLLYERDASLNAPPCGERGGNRHGPAQEESDP